ncbi:probable insulin-like peptide 1 [Rhagoletis pomonella]|uniref:probable insulin-like peptide 1 n=1 Tax=Rhagoletis pomonella TaxID=28610 RepID=UPI001781825C|nr:probable insulin-like peptide 1 [Rhagoletis pomonella]
MTATAVETFWWLFMSSTLLCQATVAQQKFCGHSLAQALDLICINGYNVLLINPSRKRSDSDMEAALATKDDYESANELNFKGFPLGNRVDPFLAKMFNMLISTRHSRSQKRSFKGIYDECCTQSCTYTELSAYCRPN